MLKTEYSTVKKRLRLILSNRVIKILEKNMSTKILIVTLLATILSPLIFTGSAKPLQTELPEGLRTVEANADGDKVTITSNQYKSGRRLFNVTCAGCHAGGATKTSPTTTLSAEDLAEAIPKRNNIEGLVDYMKNPTTTDGETEISELHPSKKSQDIFTSMRNLNDDDLSAIAGYILIEGKRLGSKWGGGTISY